LHEFAYVRHRPRGEELHLAILSRRPINADHAGSGDRAQARIAATVGNEWFVSAAARASWRQPPGSSFDRLAELGSVGVFDWNGVALLPVSVL
jgi:hypothetical protein